MIGGDGSCDGGVVVGADGGDSDNMLELVKVVRRVGTCKIDGDGTSAGRLVVYLLVDD